MKKISEEQCGLVGISPEVFDALSDCRCEDLQKRNKELEELLSYTKHLDSCDWEDSDGCACRYSDKIKLLKEKGNEKILLFQQ